MRDFSNGMKNYVLTPRVGCICVCLGVKNINQLRVTKNSYADLGRRRIIKDYWV